ncbi:MAG TPA: hypothetical protein VHD33_03830 [Legionellaceae bacterium]|nr:hypothetical protein [Legionellaceae bacterium]
MPASVVPIKPLTALSPQLLQEFKQLCQVPLDKPSNENRKLEIIQAIEHLLKNKMQHNPIIPLSAEDEETITNYQQTLIKLSYQFCMIFGFFEKAAESFLFGSNLFAVIPGISNPTLLFLTCVYTLLDALLFYAFEISLLKKAFGIVFSDDNATLLNKIYQQQLQSVIHINIFLHGAEIWDWEAEYREQMIKCMTVFNQHLIRKQQTMKAYHRDAWKMGIEYGVIAFGSISSIADSYFMAKTALLALHISFMTSPIAWILIVGMVTASLMIYYATSVKSVMKLLNPDRKSYHALQERLTLFKSTYEHNTLYVPEKYRTSGSMPISA